MKKNVIIALGIFVVICIGLGVLFYLSLPNPTSLKDQKIELAGQKITNSEYVKYKKLIEHFLIFPAGDDLDNAKRISFFVFNYFNDEKDRSYRLGELFSNPFCKCGGRVFLFRAFAENFKLKTRYAYLYNIPNQGNHSLVEVFINEKWHLFDPTFGIYFSDDGAVESDVLSLADVNYSLIDKKLTDFIVKAQKIKTELLQETLRLPLSKMYESGVFEEAYMDIENYITAERYGYHDPFLSTILSVKLDMAEKSSQFGKSKDLSIQNEQHLLNISNQYLNDNNRENDFSFLITTIGLNAVNQSILIQFKNLEPYQKYLFDIRGNTRGKTQLQMLSLDNGIKLSDIAPITIGPGGYEKSILFVAAADEGSLLVSVYPTGKMASIKLYDLNCTKYNKIR